MLPQTQSPGLTSGAKAGIAIGIVLAIAVLAGLAFFIVLKRRREKSRGDLAGEVFLGGDPEMRRRNLGVVDGVDDQPVVTRGKR